MNAYIVQTSLFYYLVHADSPLDAWTTTVTTDIDYFATDSTELQNKLLTQGFSTITPSKFEGVFIVDN